MLVVNGLNFGIANNLQEKKTEHNVQQIPLKRKFVSALYSINFCGDL